MDKNSKIYVAGHRGLVGSALIRQLQAKGYKNLLTRSHAELDLKDTPAVKAFFESEKPEYVFLAAAKVGGIHANNTYPAEFIQENLAIQNNVIHQSYLNGVKRLLFLGSSCIYPSDCAQPIREEYLLTGPLEPTNRPYALAKISGIEMCWSYNRQYGTNYLAVMPTNLYGLGDNYHAENSHVIPGLIRKFHEAKTQLAKVSEVWGSGKPYREFLFSDDMALACIFILELSDDKYVPLVAKDRNIGLPPVINIGCGSDLTIRELAILIKDVVGFKGEIIFNPAKPDGTFRKLMDSSRLNQLGWNASITLRQGLETAYTEFKATSTR
jgi:GDP-L-fucose synthase